MQTRFDQIFENGVLVDSTPRPYTWDEIRQLRAPLLERADIEINKAQDAGDAQAEAIWRAYRVALRNVPQAFETADEVEWPVEPGE
jgi:hypothetical protein